MKLPLALLLAAVALGPATTGAADKPRARELGLVPLIGGTAGRHDAITDVPGVEVGHTTLVSGDGRLVPFKGPVQHALAALDGAGGWPVAEGNVGGGTGMICHSFKGGIGTASRVLAAEDGGYTVGVRVTALPHDRLLAALRKYGRIR